MEFALDGKRVFAGTGGREDGVTGPAVALLHGAGMDHTVFAYQARALAHRGRRLLAFDFPGHGRSEGPALAAIPALGKWVLRALDAAGIDRFRIAGHSMGALVALEAAAQSGGRAEALALLGFAPEMRVHPDLLAAARAGSRGATDLMTSWSLGPRSRLGTNAAPGLWLTQGARRLLERADPASLAAALAACDAYDNARAAAADVRCPTRLLLGGADRMTPPGRAQSFAWHFAAAQVQVLPGVGHMIMMEDPAATLDALKSIL